MYFDLAFTKAIFCIALQELTLLMDRVKTLSLCVPLCLYIVMANPSTVMNCP